MAPAAARDLAATREAATELVFPSSAGTPLDDANIRKAVARIVAHADVRRRRKILDVFRHTFGSLLIQHGESLAYVREQMATHPSR